MGAPVFVVRLVAGVGVVDDRASIAATSSGGQREVEDVDVLGDAVGLDRLRDRAEAVFDVPAKDDLRRGLAVLGREVGDTRVGRWAAGYVAGAGHGDEDAAERRPSLGDDAQLGVDLPESGLGEVRVQLDLVDPRHDVRAVDQVPKVLPRPRAGIVTSLLCPPGTPPPRDEGRPPAACRRSASRPARA
jgi:hypothetical protein